MQLNKKEYKKLRLQLLSFCVAMQPEVSKALKKNSKTSDDYKIIRQFESITKFRTGIFFE